MRHFIVGTAGHIDHGKTSLIESLTGQKTDRLKEEQERGISIELGFTYFDLPNGKRAGIIDVPGHEKFIKNMLSGIVGVDIVILVVAADEGVMPQTMEHLDILNLIGVEKGFIVINKIDLVDDEWLGLIEEDIKEAVKNTFLEDSPLVKVSSKTGEGIDSVIKLIDKHSKSLEEININEYPRLPVDRSFSVSGFGTIVTGTLLSGAIHLGDELEIYPKDLRVRVRSIQIHGEDVDIAYAGQRVAINLAGIDRTQAVRGDVLALPDTMVSSSILDVKFKLLESVDRPIKNRSRLRLYIGSKEVLCRIVLLDRKVLKPGETSYAQLLLEEEIAVKIEDRFVIRFYSPMFTIGGGKILDSNPSKKKRFDNKTIEELELKDRGNPKEIVENVILKDVEMFVSKSKIISNLQIMESEIDNIIRNLLKEGKIIQLNLLNDMTYIHEENYKILSKRILSELSNYHEKYPLRIGMLKEEIRSKYLYNISKKAGEMLLNQLELDNSIEQKKEFIKVKDYKVKVSEKDLKLIDEILDFVNKDIISKRKDLVEKIGQDSDIEEIINYLLLEGAIIKLDEETYIGKKQLSKAKTSLVAYLEKNEKIDIAIFRDLLQTNRKTSILLLEYFDDLRLTKRIENHRVLI